MNISAQRFETRFRTWLLIAGLTALLIGIGALIGGVFLYVFAALAVALNVVGYWFSDRLALKASGAPLDGAISGRALYEGRIDLGEAVRLLAA